MRLGLSIGLGTPFSSSVLNPATLGLTGWWKASFSASPWTDQVAGGNRNLAEATNPPSAGTAVNGFTPASFDGTNDILKTVSTTSTFFATSAYGIVALIKVTAFTVADPGASAPYTCTSVLGMNRAGNVDVHSGVAGSGASGVYRVGHHNGTSFNSSATAISTGAWVMVAGGFDGTNISTSINAGTVTNVAHSNSGAFSGNALEIGGNYTGAQFFNGLVLEGMVRNTKFSATELSDIKSYFNNRYALSL